MRKDEKKVSFTGQKTRACPRKIARSRTQNEERREKSGLRGAKNERDLSKNRSKSDQKRGKTRKKWASQGKKRAHFLEKSPENGLKTEKSGKNGDFGAKKVGWGSGGKMGFTADFAML